MRVVLFIRGISAVFVGLKERQVEMVFFG